MSTDRQIEAVADLVHEVWARWIANQLPLCAESADGSLTIPEAKAVRWRRQSATAYADLPEEEKASDRKIASDYLDLCQSLAEAEAPATGDPQ